MGKCLAATQEGGGLSLVMCSLLYAQLHVRPLALILHKELSVILLITSCFDDDGEIMSQPE